MPLGRKTLFVVVLPALVIAGVTFHAFSVVAQDRDDMNRGLGPGIGIGVGVGIGIIEGVTEQPPKPAKKGNPPPAKKGQKPDDTPQKGKTADTPPPEKGKTADTPPPGKGQTPDNPPPPQTTDQPQTTGGGPPPPPGDRTTEKVPGTGPDQPGTTPDNPVGTTPTGETVQKADDCPQRGKGCVALIIDWLLHEENAPTLTEGLKQTLTPLLGVDPTGGLSVVRDALLARHCEVKYVDVDIWMPKADKHGIAIESPAQRSIRDEHNKDQNQRIKDAIAAHHERLKAGTEVAIEILAGHGSSANGRGDCGSVGPAEGLQGIDVQRQKFHAENYALVRRNTCQWFVADMSCHSAYTPEVVDALNNRGATVPTLLPGRSKKLAPVPTACTGAAAINCANHAAYELDIALGQTGYGYACSLFTPGLAKDLAAAVDPVGTTWHLHDVLKGGIVTFSSKYGDRGYKYCEPHTREGYDLRTVVERRKP